MFRDKDKNISVCPRNDNSDVKVATNKADSVSLAMSKCTRWSKMKKEVVCVPQPVMIQQYNKGMGGVDLFDQFRGKYRVAFRKRLVLSSTQTSSECIGCQWVAYVQKNPQGHRAGFLREIVNALLKPSEKPLKFIPLKTPDCVRYDGKDHNIVMGDTQRRCGVCKKNVQPKRTKCNVALHVQCWVKYRTKYSST